MPSSQAPIFFSGSTIRAIGRRRSDASPSRTASMPSPAKIPANSRIEVPELPQSSGEVGAVSLPVPSEATT